MGFLAGKRALIVGLASNRSIAWGIARAFAREGAELALSYQNERLGERVRRLGAELGAELFMPLDVGDDAEIERAFATLAEHWDGLDVLVHSVAFAPREELKGDFVDQATRAGFLQAQDISAFSLVALARAARALMRGRSAAILTLSYLGAVRFIPNYNVMGPAKASLEANVRYLAASLGPEGTRVNAISAGPIRTLAAAGIADFRRFLDLAEEASPLRRNVTIDEVGSAAAFLCSELASAITGEVLYVDAGYHCAGLVAGG